LDDFAEIVSAEEDGETFIEMPVKKQNLQHVFWDCRLWQTIPDSW
jgi:hypothetical protein